jgi:hypothetical protein
MRAGLGVIIPALGPRSGHRLVYPVDVIGFRGRGWKLGLLHETHVVSVAAARVHAVRLDGVCETDLVGFANQ